jgi:hypothetical protein
MREANGLFTYTSANGAAMAGLVVYVNGRIHKRTSEARTGKVGHVLAHRPGAAPGEPPARVKASVRVFELGHLPPPETLDAGSPTELF